MFYKMVQEAWQKDMSHLQDNHEFKIDQLEIDGKCDWQKEYAAQIDAFEQKSLRMLRLKLYGAFILFLLLLGLCFSTAPLNAQVGQNYFAADPSNLFDWRAALQNPSIGAFQNGAVEIGYKIHHLGFADNNAGAFRSSYALLNLPRRLPEGIAIGFQMQFFNNPLLQEGQMNLSISRKFSRLVSVGFGIGLRNLSYNTDNFNLVDIDDPVFARGTSRWQPDISAGITVLPFSPVVLGLGISHLNRPSVSLIGDDVRLNPMVTLGLSLNFGAYGVHTGGNRSDQTTTTRAFVQLRNESVGWLQLGYQERAAWLRGMLRVSGPLSIGYGFGYPLQDLQGASFGNHEASMVYEFDQMRAIPEIDLPSEADDSFIPEMSHVDVVPQYFITADVEKLNIIEKHLLREFDEGLDEKALNTLSAFDIGVLDSSITEDLFPFELEKQYFHNQTPGDSLKYSSEYQSALANLKDDISGQQAEVIMVAPPMQERRAAELEEFFSEENSSQSQEITLNQPLFKTPEDSLRMMQRITMADLLKQDTISFMNPQEVAFTVYPVLPERLSSDYTLVIENEDAETAFASHHSLQDPGRVSWNWRDANGELLSPGYYRYYVSWHDEWGQERRSAARTLYVRKLQRNIKIRITRDYQSGEGGIDKVGIILSK